MNNLAPSTPGDPDRRCRHIKGNLAKLTPEEKSNYYFQCVCESLGLNPLTKPFEYLTLQGKETLYARRDCTDQLRNIHNVSVEELSESRREDIFIVTAKVHCATPRAAPTLPLAPSASTTSEAKALANAIMKAETKAKKTRDAVDMRARIPGRDGSR